MLINADVSSVNHSFASFIGLSRRRRKIYLRRSSMLLFGTEWWPELDKVFMTPYFTLINKLHGFGDLKVVIAQE